MVEVAPSEAGGPQKKLYSITERGINEFSRWLAESPQRPMLIRDTFLLKFAFFGFGEDERAMEIIDEQIEIFKDQLKRRKINRRRWERQGIYVRLIAELGITQIEMYLDWLRHARAEIEKSSKGAVPKKSLAFL
jgi:DNA-binding PadR family transcriptional regulator